MTWPPLTSADAADLIRVDAAWEPFSRVEQIWHGCPGHDWRRVEWRGQHVTRCERCGAPRCDIYHRPDDVTVQVWALTGDHARQQHRCTLERHHEEPHDFLDGTRVDIGGDGA